MNKLVKNNNLKQFGGNGDKGNSVIPVITKTKTSKGTPFITNSAKEIYHRAKEIESNTTAKEINGEKKLDQKKKIPSSQVNPASVKSILANQPALRLELYDTQPKQSTFDKYAPYAQYLPKVRIPGTSSTIIPSYLSYLSAPTGAVSYGPNLQMPVQQVYNINLPGPTGGHVEMSKIYENILPGKENKFTSTTLGERLQIYDYVRQILININDGEDISIDADGHRSILSYIKFMELNPNYYSPLYSNPYKGLPLGLLIYRACFPIKLDAQSQSIICAKDSIGLNIRLYSLTIAEYYSYKFRQVIYREYDVWREVAFYEYIRENIIKKRQCPNFPLLYAFFLSPNKKIDFFSLKRNCLRQKDLLTEEYKRFLVVHGLRPPTKHYVRPMSYPEVLKHTITKLPDETDPLLQLYSGTTLLLITEAPHHNLYQWASRIYEKEGIVNKMISNGYHDANVWISVLFQITYALYIMQYHGIYMRQMTIADNIYIKDLQTYGKAAGYWKYIINGISYYVPNYGYVVLVDSNFKDIIPEARTLDRPQREYKIYTYGIFGKKYRLGDIRKKVYENYKMIINTNSFTKEHTQNNVFKPPESVMKLLELMTLDTEEDLAKVIFKYFRPLMNNRIGTFLKKENEVPNIRDITTNFKPGEMAIQVIGTDAYKWCMVSNIGSDGIISIITRDKPNSADFLDQDVRVETLKQYSITEKIEQIFDPNIVNLSEDALLETYMIE